MDIRLLTTHYYPTQQCQVFRVTLHAIYQSLFASVSQDGDYNKPIPSQWSEDLNHPISLESGDRGARNYNSGSDQLCEACNRNQLLKIRQLSNYVPYNEVKCISL